MQDCLMHNKEVDCKSNSSGLCMFQNVCDNIVYDAIDIRLNFPCFK
jgi:hypothetical protein